MADEENKTTDEIVDDIPENAQKISEDSKVNYTGVNIEASRSESSLMSVLSLALGIFSLICCCTIIPAGISSVIGLILGILALRGKEENSTLAILGIILCALGLAVFIVTGAFWIIAGSVNATFEIPATMHSMTM